MANLLLSRDDEKEETPGLEKDSPIKELQNPTQVKGIRITGRAQVQGHTICHLTNPGYKM
jgi:hypothetical protein